MRGRFGFRLVRWRMEPSEVGQFVGITLPERARRRKGLDQLRRFRKNGFVDRFAAKELAPSKRNLSFCHHLISPLLFAIPLMMLARALRIDCWPTNKSAPLPYRQLSM